MSSEYNHSVRFNPSRNYGADSSEQGTFLSGPKIPGLPCIACSMSRTPCDGGSPCRPCILNRLRCHYEGDNNTRFFGIDALQLDQPLSLQQHQLQHDNRDNPDNHPPQSGSADSSSSSLHPSRSRSRSDSGSASGSGSSPGPRNGHEHSYPRVSPLISSPITLSDQSLISIPPFQELTNQDRSQHSKVVLPSISSMGVPLSSASISSSNSRSSTASKTTISSSSSSRTSKSNVQRLSATRVITLSNERAGSSQLGSSAGVDPVVRRPSTKKQLQQQAQAPKDPLYSLSSASIRARRNALEMENIQRASHLYADFIAKIKALSVPTTADSDTANKITTTYLSENELSSFNKMEVDQTNDAGPSSALAAGGKSSREERPTPTFKAVSSSSNGSTMMEKEHESLEGLKRMARSGLLHSLIQQYFTLIHPQFMILHKNQFLVRFWMWYGPFPEAKELQSQLAQRHSQIMEQVSPEMVWKGPIEPLQSTGTKNGESPGPQKASSLLMMAMLALVSRHINDRSPLKSTTAYKQRLIQTSFVMVSAELSLAEHADKCQEKVQERLLEEIMETDEQGQSLGENLKDRGEQYFQWASELLKHEYEEPSLTVVQSLLLLREYAIMAGNHTQAYMYGGTAITMAMGLGWHHAHLVQATQRDDNINVSASEKGSAEEKSDVERRRESKAKDEEQKLCWWHCFIVDRWMSAAYNRPVVS
ncbi:fungal-specific transcription factor domain-containing protein [Dissophora ornata]|nr:fungal-specific transcription factor domain-containing protein [Dissophora ornata]